MPRTSAYGIRGLRRDPETGLYLIDLKYRDREGQPQRYSEHFPPKTRLAFAKERAIEVLRLAQEGQLDQAKANAPTHLKSGLQWYADNHFAKPDRRRNQVIDHIVRSAGNPYLHRVRGHHLETVVQELEQAGRAASTLNKRIILFKAAAKQWRSRDWITEAAFRGIRAVKTRNEQNDRVRWFEDWELEALIREIAPGVRPFFLAAVLTGCRRGELLQLKVEDIDFAQGWIRIYRGKTDANDHVYLHPQLVPVLKDCISKTRCEYVFAAPPSFDGPYHEDAVSRAFARACERAGVENARLHDLRHHFATMLKRNGSDLATIAALLGHSRRSGLVMTLRYAHIEDRTRQEAIAGLPDMPLAQLAANGA